MNSRIIKTKRKSIVQTKLDSTLESRAKADMLPSSFFSFSFSISLKETLSSTPFFVSRGEEERGGVYIGRIELRTDSRTFCNQRRNPLKHPWRSSLHMIVSSRWSNEYAEGKRDQGWIRISKPFDHFGSFAPVELKSSCSFRLFFCFHFLFT